MHKEIFTTKKNIKDTTIALISDIHYHNTFNSKLFDKITKQIKNAHPDYIAIAGDILDTTTTTDMTVLEEFLKNIAAITTTIVILGNHDEKQGEMKNWSYKKNQKLISILNNIENIHLLTDTTYQEDNITFYGFNPSFKYYEEDKETYESFCNEIKDLNCNIPKDTYNVTLIHTPINIYKFLSNNKEHNLNNSDLILSGHMHNGCLPLWMSNIINKAFKTSRSIISPTRKIFPKYAQGRIYERDGYIYEGLFKFSKSTKFFHIFDKFYHKQITIIKIKKEQ